MPKSNGTIKVKSIPGEPMRFYVESWSNPQEPHLVDLSEHGGMGECSCTDWPTRCYPNFKKHGKWIEYWGADGKPNPDRTMCKHVHVCRVHVLNAHLKEQAAILHPVQP